MDERKKQQQQQQQQQQQRKRGEQKRTSEREKERETAVGRCTSREEGGGTKARVATNRVIFPASGR